MEAVVGKAGHLRRGYSCPVPPALQKQDGGSFGQKSGSLRRLKREWGMGSGEWGVGYFSPFPTPHSPFPLLVPAIPQDNPRIETSIFFKLLVASITAVGS